MLPVFTLARALKPFSTQLKYAGFWVAKINRFPQARYDSGEADSSSCQKMRWMRRRSQRLFA